ncbi:MAG: YqeG family HAD IIIA-type phosphatase [bacterium]|nr:YqeG family HAD IIIA-type phosphatase [bacterium]
MSFLLPNKIFPRLTDIKIKDLDELNIKAVLLDVDNTLTVDHGKAFIENAQQWIDDVLQSGRKILIMSNGKRKRLSKLLGAVGLECISMSAKPLPFSYWLSAIKLETPIKNILMVGDQLFTDVLGAKLSGAKAFLVKPIEPEVKFSFVIRRRLENRYLKKHCKDCEGL